METAKSTLKNESNDGKITEQKYETAGATHTFEAVAVKNTTQTQKLDIKSVLTQNLTLAIKDKTKPAVLIFHTHTTETYELLDRGYYSNAHSTRSPDNGVNMVRVGKAITEQLEAAGFAVIHDTRTYDASYNGAYARSLASIEEYKKKYPELQVILDVHRDAIKTENGTKIKPTAEINGKKAAQIMIITGCQEQGITGYDNWQQNLRFALRLQKQAQAMYPGLMRPVLFCARKYNMNTSPCSLLLEFGSDSSTLEEAVYAGKMMGNTLAALLNQHVVKA
jgi:stage II sporulation protein P